MNISYKELLLRLKKRPIIKQIAEVDTDRNIVFETVMIAPKLTYLIMFNTRNLRILELASMLSWFEIGMSRSRDTLQYSINNRCDSHIHPAVPVTVQPESVFIEAGVLVKLFAEFLTDEKAAHH